MTFDAVMCNGVPGSERPILLVVDDDRAIRSMVSDLLSAEGYEVLQADGADQALQLAQSATLDLLVTDFSMPCVDGLQLTAMLRYMRPQLPVLMMSGSPPHSSRTKGLPLFDVMAKPFGLSELLIKVRALLEAAALPSKENGREPETAEASLLKE